MHYLKIAAPKALWSCVPKDWQVVELTANLNPATLAAVVVDASEESQLLGQKFSAQLQLPLPVLTTTDTIRIAQEAHTYEQQVQPPFIRDLINFANQKPVSFTTPGHHNGQYYDRHPAGVIYHQFMGDNLLRADTSDTVPELGDTMTHAGTPLLAQQEAARAFNADKVYFCTNGTTSANTICANALLGEGDLVLFDRNNHKSLYNSALVMTGAKPVYLPTDRNAQGLIGPIVDAALDETYIRQEIAKVDPERAQAKRPFRLAALQLETFDGVFYDARYLIEKLGHLCDYILFDCAWGGYEQFVEILKDLSPLQINYGPDDPGILVTQSIHKQQAGMGQASQILKKDHHIKGQARYVDHKHFNHTYLKYVTTSYSYPIYSSLVMNAALANSPANSSWWEETLALGIDFRKQLLAQSELFKPLVPVKVGQHLWQDIPTSELAHNLAAWRLDPKEKWHGFELAGAKEVVLSPLKITISSLGVDNISQSYQDKGIPGQVVGTYLRSQGIIPVKSDLYSTLYLLTPGEGLQEMQRLLKALLDFETAYKQNKPLAEVMPKLYEEYKTRYYGYGLADLCQEIHNYYREHEIFKLQKALFLKQTFQDYSHLPKEADVAFLKNQSELVSLDQVLGRVALEGALPYPPGVFIVAPGEKWQKIDIDYFKILIGAQEKFPGFDPEIQGVYQEVDEQGQKKIMAEVWLKN